MNHCCMVCWLVKIVNPLNPETAKQQDTMPTHVWNEHSSIYCPKMPCSVAGCQCQLTPSALVNLGGLDLFTGVCGGNCGHGVNLHTEGEFPLGP
jgi:hypothetical protein